MAVIKIQIIYYVKIGLIFMFKKEIISNVNYENHNSALF